MGNTLPCVKQEMCKNNPLQSALLLYRNFAVLNRKWNKIALLKNDIITFIYNIYCSKIKHLKDANEKRNNNTLEELHYHIFPSYSSIHKFIIRRGDESEWKHITADKKRAKIIGCSLPRFSIETLQSPPRNRADPTPLYTSPQCTPAGLVNIHGVTRPLFRGVVLRGKRYGRSLPSLWELLYSHGTS